MGLAPGGPQHGEALARAGAGDPVAISSATLAEIAFGLRQGIAGGHPDLAAPLAWWIGAEDLGLVDVLPIDGGVAVAAGQVRALHRHPPTRRRARRGAKSENRVAWYHDILIGCTAWAHGRSLRTADRTDFEAIAEALQTLSGGVAERLAIMAD